MVSDLREKVLSVLLIVLLFNIIALRNGATPIHTVQAQQMPNMYIYPAEIRNSSAVAGQNFTISINITNVERLFGWQANITFNKAVVNCTSLSKIVRGSWFDSKFGGAGYTQFIRSINYAAGYLLVACAKKTAPYTGNGASGNGTLAYITFKVIANERATLLAFGVNTYLNTAVSDYVVGPIEPFTTEDGSFDNRQPQVNVTPVADFEYTHLGTEPEGERFEFNPSLSYDPDAWLERYYWDYGDGTTGLYIYNRSALVTEKIPHRGNWTVSVVHAYEHAGNYTIMLTVTDNDGATDTFTRDVVLRHDIAVMDVKTPYIAVMPGILVPVNVTVSNIGNYTETFDVNAYFNETLIETKSIIDMPAYSETNLTFTWDTTGVALGNYVLNANTSEVAGEIYTLNNAYTDGVLTIAPSNVVQFQTSIAGRTFTTQVESTSMATNFNFDRIEKKIGFNLTGAFGWFSNVTIPMALLNVSSPSAWIVKFDGNNITYTRTSNGTHYFIYFEYAQSAEPHAVDIIGESAATPPIALFTTSKTTAIAGESITFDASASHDPDGTIESWNWNFGIADTDTGEIVQHSFATNGTYIVTLTVKDNEQMTNSTQKTITVIDYPIASFSYSPEEPLVDQTITFDATASNPVGGTITTYAWKFGDDQTATGATTTHSYSTTGTYTVNLTVTDSESLTNSTQKTITVTIHDIAITSLTTSPGTVKIGETVTIQITVANKGNFTESFTVTTYENDTEIETKQVSNLIAGNSQLLTISWNTANVGPSVYTIRATTSAITGETRTDDNSASGVVNVQKKSSSLTIDASPSTLNFGAATTISGTLSPTLQGVTVTLQYRLTGETWSTLDTVITDSQGKYLFIWTPTKAGTYEIQAIWQGDTNTQAGQSEVQTVTVNEAKGSENLLYAVVAVVIIILVAAAVYFLVLRRR